MNSEKYNLILMTESEVVMFIVGDYVIYGIEGVCRVDSIGNPGISGLDETKTYYTLSPVYRCGKIHTPVDTAISMRKVVTGEYAKELISKIGDIDCDLDVPKDQKLANIYYRDLVRTNECRSLISVIKYVFNKQRRFAEIKRNLPAVDVKFSKMAEEMLCSEFAFAMGIEPKAVKSLLDNAFRETAPV